MTSNGNDDVNHQQNQQNKAQNGISPKKCGNSMPQGIGTNRKTNRSNHSMGLKRPRSVDPAAGMC